MQLRKRALVNAAAFAAVSSWLAACSACSSSPSDASEASGGGAGGASASAGGTSAGGGVSPAGTGGSGEGGAAGGGGSAGGAGDGCAPPRPPQIPEGWQPFTDFSCQMPLWLPATPEQLPAPIQWEPCGNEIDQPGIACRRMVVSWPHKGPTTAVEASLHVSDGTPLIFFMRSSGAHEDTQNTLLISEVDGEVLFAASAAHRLTEGLRIQATPGFDGKRFGIALRGATPGSHSDEPPVQGVAVGTVGELGLQLFRTETIESALSWGVNSHYVERTSAIEQTSDIFPIDGGDPTRLYSLSDDPDGLQLAQPLLVGSDAVWEIGNLRMTGVLSYTPAAGTQPLVRWKGDTAKGAYHVGTDGTDLVWTFGEEHEAGEGVYLKKTIMTAPYTASSDGLAPRALHSDPTYGYNAPFVVGCGYAAHDVGGNGGLQVVRLSDGRSWNIGADSWKSVGRVVGVTCDEVFFELSNIEDDDPVYDETTAYARVRLDSLGAGTPSDL